MRLRFPGGVLRPTARRLGAQVEDQSGAYQTEGDTRRDEGNQHGGLEAGKNNE
jgi:hypothetical protein